MCSGQDDSHNATYRFSHTPAGQRFALMCWIYSSRKYFSVVSTGLAAVCPRPHNAESLMDSARPSSVLRSCSDASPSATPCRILNICAVPSRQGVHFPQDSLVVNPIKYRATSTMQLSWSITTMPPDPMMAPSSDRCS